MDSNGTKEIRIPSPVACPCSCSEVCRHLLCAFLRISLFLTFLLRNRNPSHHTADSKIPENLFLVSIRPSVGSQSGTTSAPKPPVPKASATVPGTTSPGTMMDPTRNLGSSSNIQCPTCFLCRMPGKHLWVRTSPFLFLLSAVVRPSRLWVSISPNCLVGYFALPTMRSSACAMAAALSPFPFRESVDHA